MRAHRAAVLGHPIAHSLSPVLHTAAYAALGLDGWRYEAVDVTQEQLPGFVDALDESWAGLSLTMPLKHAVLPLLDHVDPLGQVVGAVNTVLVQHVGATRTLVGANTDVHGIVAALREGLTAAPRTAAVLGGGATAASALAALAELGVPDAAVYVRSAGRAAALVRAAHRMGVSPRLRGFDVAAGELTGYDVVVATLPSHAADDLAGALSGAPTGTLLDVVYDPRLTALGAVWRQGGGTVVGGDRMLLHQAAEQVRLMTGRPAPLEAMAHALAERLTEPDH